ncbi:MAG: glycosyltransferase family 2 protein [Ruminococcus sp.]|nr:glycosyltransferase family 2 protein [Candidatus Copronaster equi]
MNYSVSVIIPVYNCKSFLSRAIESVINQNVFSLIQLILVDDGSSDGSRKICDEYSDRYENIISIHQKNSGVSVARNTGIENADGEWISFLDSDDYFISGAFEKILKKPADLICWDYTFGSDTKNISFKKDYYKKDEFDKELYPIMANDFIFYNCWNKLYKKSIIKENNLVFPKEKKYGEDMEFLFEYIKHIEDFSFIDEQLYFYYQNENSVTLNMKNSFNACKNNYLWLYKYFGEIECDSEKYQKLVSQNFVFRTCLSMWDIGFNYGVSEGKKVIKEILNDPLFAEMNEKYPQTKFEHKYYKKMYELISKKDYTGIMIFVKKYRLKSQIYSKLKA